MSSSSWIGHYCVESGIIWVTGHLKHETESLCLFHFKHSHWWKRWSRSKYASHYTWGTNRVSEMQDGGFTSSTLIGGKGGAGPNTLHTTLEGPTEEEKCKMEVNVYMGSYVASYGSCFMVTRTGFQNHLLEVGLTQNRWWDMGLWTFTTADLLYFIMWEDPARLGIAIGWGPGHTWLHTTLEGPWPHYMILEVSWDGLWTLSFGLSQICGHGLWLVCVSGPKFRRSYEYLRIFITKVDWFLEGSSTLRCGLQIETRCKGPPWNLSAQTFIAEGSRTRLYV